MASKPPASPSAPEQAALSEERANQIAAMKNFGLQEFIELTGIRASAYGIYRLSREGVSVGVSSNQELEGTSAEDQVKTLAAEKVLSLSFPCTQDSFLEWYESTRGTNGISDFTLAPGYLKALSVTNQSARDHLGK